MWSAIGNELPNGLEESQLQAWREPPPRLGGGCTQAPSIPCIRAELGLATIAHVVIQGPLYLRTLQESVKASKTSWAGSELHPSIAAEKPPRLQVERGYSRYFSTFTHAQGSHRWKRSMRSACAASKCDHSARPHLCHHLNRHNRSATFVHALICAFRRCRLCRRRAFELSQRGTGFSAIDRPYRRSREKTREQNDSHPSTHEGCRGDGPVADYCCFFKHSSAGQIANDFIRE